MTTEREREDARRQNPNQPVAAQPPPQPQAQAPQHRDAIPPEQLSTPPAGPPHLGGKQVQAVIGPHAGRVLTMPEAEADQAISDHWAVELRQPPFDPANQPEHAPLDDAEKQAASDAAIAWSNEQLPNVEPTNRDDRDDKDRRTTATRGGVTGNPRTMTGGPGGGYDTRGAAPQPHPNEAPEPHPQPAPGKRP